MNQSLPRARWHGSDIGLLRPMSWFTLSWHSSVSIESLPPNEGQGLSIVRPNEILQATEGGTLLSLQAPGGITDDLLPIGGGTVGVLGALALGYRYWNRGSSD